MRRIAFRWRLVALLSGVSVVTVTAWSMAGVASSDPPSPAPGYLSGDYSTMLLASNNLMSGATFVGKTYPAQAGAGSTPEMSGPIWTHSCPAGAETVKFGRYVWLPGPPNYGGKFTFGAVLGQHELFALSTIDLIVNGDVIVHQRMPTGPGQYTVPLGAAAMKAFRPEQNLIEVRVHKNAYGYSPSSGKTHGPCNTGNPATQLGVLFRLAGQFETDLAVNPPPPDAYYKFTGGATSVTPVVNVHFRNQGPAWEPSGTFWLDIVGPQNVAIQNYPAGPPPGPPLTNCQVYSNGVNSHRVTCGLSNFAPGTEGVLSVIYNVTAQPADSSVYFHWYVGAGAVTDLNTSNNDSHATNIYCGTKSTTPACQ